MSKYDGCNWVASTSAKEVVNKTKRKNRINVRIIIACCVFALCFCLIKFTPAEVSNAVKSVIFFDPIGSGEAGDSIIVSLFT